MVQPRTVADEDIPNVRDKIDDGGRRTQTGSDKDISSDEDSNLSRRPVTESATAWAGSGTDSPSGVHVKCCKQPVTESVTAQATDTEEPLVMVSTVTMELWNYQNSEPVFVGKPIQVTYLYITNVSFWIVGGQ